MGDAMRSALFSARVVANRDKCYVLLPLSALSVEFAVQKRGAASILKRFHYIENDL